MRLRTIVDELQAKVTRDPSAEVLLELREENKKFIEQTLSVIRGFSTRLHEMERKAEERLRSMAEQVEKEMVDRFIKKAGEVAASVQLDLQHEVNAYSEEARSRLKQDLGRVLRASDAQVAAVRENLTATARAEENHYRTLLRIREEGNKKLEESLPPEDSSEPEVRL